VAQECVETKDGLAHLERPLLSQNHRSRDGARAARIGGELVLTSLAKQAFPIVRYRTRDLTALLPGTARTMRRMHKTTGHCDDMIILRGVNLFLTQIE
jgi:phenylacetate-CoA ligase